MSKENEMECLGVEVDIESWLRRPAVTSRNELYLIDGTKVIGKVRKVSATSHPNRSGLYTRVSVDPDDDATKDYFNNDEFFQTTGMLFLKFDGIFGERWTDIDDPRYLDLKVVDCIEFDFGICHPSFSDVEGFDSHHKKQNSLRIRTKHKARRARTSNKIKKVATYEYLQANISMSPPAFREELFAKVEYVDDYTWYVTLGDEVKEVGDHFITIRTKHLKDTKYLILDLCQKHSYSFDASSDFFLSLGDLPKSIQRLTEKYGT